jgi:hypothetical protein
MDKEKPVMAVESIGETPMSPMIWEVGTVEIPLFARMANLQAAPRSTEPAVLELAGGPAYADRVGALVGPLDGGDVGGLVGVDVGRLVGGVVGPCEGDDDGRLVGIVDVGGLVGAEVGGLVDGDVEGKVVEGPTLGKALGVKLGPTLGE